MQSSNTPDVDPKKTGRTAHGESSVEARPRNVSSEAHFSVEDVLSQHEEWLRSGRLNGARADFAHVHLAGQSLSGADLRFADLSHVDLSSTDFHNADLTDASLVGTRLCKADLTSVKGLLVEQLAGSNLRGARLPTDILVALNQLSVVNDHIHVASGVFVTLLIACLYCWLTVASTADVSLIADSEASPLPIINTEVSIARFYAMSPALLIALFLYFHIYLQRLWERLALLPAVFPDGAIVDQKVFPWLMNSLIHPIPEQTSGSRPALLRLHKILLQILGWWLVPVTVLLLWARCLIRHDWVLTGAQLVFATIAIVIAAGFSSLRHRTLLRSVRPSRRLLPFPATVTASSCLLLIMMSHEVIDGALLRGVGIMATYELPVDKLEEPKVTALMYQPLQQFRVLRWLKSVRVFRRAPDWTGVEQKGPITAIHYPGSGWSGRTERRADSGVALLEFEYVVQIVADLTDAQLSKKPATWTGRSETEATELSQVEGARLRASDLRWAAADNSFLVNADLRSAQLAYAHLENADLRRSRLEEANLTGSHLADADLREATIPDADFSGAVLDHANVAGVDFSDARGLQLAQLRKARNWFLAKYDAPTDFELPDDHNKRIKYRDFRRYQLNGLDLQGANFRNADLSRADLRGSRFDDADFASADLSNACLAGADLALANGLAGTQIDRAIVDETTTCPAPLRDRCLSMARRRRRCP